MKPTYEELERQNIELKQQNDSLNRYYRSVVDNSMDAILLTAPDGNVFFANQAACDLFQMTQQEIIDGGRMAVLDEEDDKLPEALEKRKKTGEFVGELNFKKKDETLFTGEVSSAIYKDTEGQTLTSIIIRDVTERKKMEKALRENEDLYRLLAENSTDLITVFKNQDMVYISPAIEIILGYSPDEFMRINHADLFHPDDKAYLVESMNTRIATMDTRPVTYEYRQKHKEGHYVWLETTVKNKIIENGYSISVLNTRDITERKKTEEALRDSEERHRLFYNPSFGGSVIHDKGIILDFSNGVTNITGYSHDELIGMDGLLLMAPDWRDFVKDKITSGFEEPYEAEGIRKDGTIFPLRLHAKTIQYRGKPARVVEFRDITELKKKEEALKESETFLKETNKIAKIGGWNYDVKNKKAVWTKEMYHIHEVPYDFVPEVNRDIVFYDERSGEILTQALNEAIVNAKPYDLELKFITAKNNKRYVRTIGRPKKDKDGKVFSVGGIFQDITEKKKAELALKASEERFRTLVDTNPFPIVVVDPKHEKILFWSNSAQELFGYEPKTPAEWFSLAYPDPQYRQAVIDRSKPYLERAQHSKTAVNTGEYQIVCRDGSVKICEIYAQCIPGHLVLTNNDITERKQAEQALKERENLLRNIINTSTDYIFVKDKNLKTILCNKVFAQAVNKKPSDLIGKTDIENGWDAELVKGSLEKGMRGYETDDLEALSGKIVQNTDTATISGKTLFFDSVKIPLKDEHNNIFGVLGISRDITDRKHIEEKLKASERKYRNIAESMPGLILKYRLNPDGSDQLLYISKGVEDLYEIQREDAVKNNALLWDRVHRDDLEEFIASVKKSAENLSFWEQEHRLKMPDGRVKWVRNRGVPNKQEDGSVVWDSLAVDITERKQAEQALKESENLLRNIIDSSTDYIFVKDKNLKTILCNKVFAQAVNKKPSDLIGKTDIENGWGAELVKGNPEKGIKGYEKDDLEALGGKIVQNTDTATVSGKTLFLDTVKIPLKDENNKVFGMLGVSRDITERKRLESEKDHLIDELKLALAKVQKLEGFLPICSYCKKIRDDLGYWQQIEQYIHERSDAQFSHSICPECAKKHFPDMDIYDD